MKIAKTVLLAITSLLLLLSIGVAVIAHKQVEKVAGLAILHEVVSDRADHLQEPQNKDELYSLLRSYEANAAVVVAVPNMVFQCSGGLAIVVTVQLLLIWMLRKGNAPDR